MPELRKDPITREWVVMAPERAKRPSDFQHNAEGSTVSTNNYPVCPFCLGNEGLTPSEIIAFRRKDTKSNTPGWWVRVIPNRFPALMVEGELHRTDYTIYDRMNGVGAHEVIIETPEHGLPMSRMEKGQIKEVLWAYRNRYLDLKKDQRLKYILIFKNHGRIAGASIEHSHSQLIATPMIPQQVWMKTKGMEQYYEYRDRCVYCNIIEVELEKKERVVVKDEHFIAIEPYASRHPFETWIISKRHKATFTDMDEAEIDSLAHILKETLLRLEVCLNDPPYNFTIITAPPNSEYFGQFHWHIEIIPRLTVAAGFELGTGIYINPVLPEEAARYLRMVKTSDLPQHL
ncbi:MAG: galactose-1-phosphate uridylyltransferase [Deltaproteobacteria bacterium]|nr:galactose-1-phosphate uridylyltransferase [Deltaproteobacteria bacterium]